MDYLAHSFRAPVHAYGRFLDTQVLLCDKVQQQVCSGGDVGRLFDTYVGIKQGSELIPLSFDMFIDILHDR